MSRKTHQASALAVAATVAFTLFSAEGSGAFAQDSIFDIIESPVSAETQVSADEAVADNTEFSAQAVVQPLPENYGKEPVETSDETASDATVDADSLAELVAMTPTDQQLSQNMQCLAGAIYFESKGEPLEGQLAVGRVIVNRADSGRFPSSYCGVVFQRSQFSFVRGGKMPRINKSSRAWREAKAIAQIANDGTWDSPAKGALFFHARYVSPGWRLQRVAIVENHVFYR
ncbi:MAG: cell wall hydrolase [Novosphingobium sp.]|nr:cell wall hydrolase [Novosphingobium sp.]